MTARQEAREAVLALMQHGDVRCRVCTRCADAASDVWARRILECREERDGRFYFRRSKLLALAAEAEEALDG